jgi:hypothetical protein
MHFGFLRRSSSVFISDEQALADEVALWDVETPDWDRPARITTAVGALERGVPDWVLDVTYGPDIMGAARVFLAAKSSESR